MTKKSRATPTRKRKATGPRPRPKPKEKKKPAASLPTKRRAVTPRGAAKLPKGSSNASTKRKRKPQKISKGKPVRRKPRVTAVTKPPRKKPRVGATSAGGSRKRPSPPVKGRRKSVRMPDGSIVDVNGRSYEQLVRDRKRELARINERRKQQREKERQRAQRERERIKAQRARERERRERERQRERERREKERERERKRRKRKPGEVEPVIDISDLTYEQLLEAAAQAKAHPEDIVPGTNEAYYEFIAQLHEMSPSEVYSTMMGSPPKVGTAS